MTLPPDIENYRKEQRFTNPRVPDDINERWLDRVVANDLHTMGERGAELYLKRFGRKIGEQKAVHLAIIAENAGYPDVAEGFWKKAFSLKTDGPTAKVKKGDKSTATKKRDGVAESTDGNIPSAHRISDVTLLHRVSEPILQGEDKRSLREWWHGILRTHGRYSCYGIFLTLPSDRQVIEYLTKNGTELNQISSKNCLVIALGKTDFQRPGIDEGSWQKIVIEQTSEGHSVTVANLFGIKYTDFPCLLFFQDIRLPGHIAIKLKDMTTEQIAMRLRLIFTTVNDAIRNNREPLDELRKQQGIELLQQSGQLVANKVGGIVEKTLEKGMEAFFNSMKGP